MQIIQLDVKAPAGTVASAGDAALVQDILWAHSGSEPGIEHIRARAGPGAVNISILLADAVQDPLGHVLRLIEDATRHSAYLAGWEITRHRPTMNEGTDQR